MPFAAIVSRISRRSLLRNFLKPDGARRIGKQRVAAIGTVVTLQARSELLCVGSQVLEFAQRFVEHRGPCG